MSKIDYCYYAIKVLLRYKIKKGLCNFLLKRLLKNFNNKKNFKHKLTLPCSLNIHFYIIEEPIITNY